MNPAPLTPAPQPRRFGAGVGFFVVVGLVALTGLLAAGYLRVFPPPWMPEWPPPQRNYNWRVMQEGMTPEPVAARQTEFAGLGNRFLGQPGVAAAAAKLDAAYRAAGLEVLGQEIVTATPVTEQRAITRVDAAGHDQPLPDVEVFPFFPNFLQPQVTPADGLTGRLVLLDEETLARREHFDEVIGLVNTAEGRSDPQYEWDWTRYAALGVKALLVTHSQGLDALPWLSVARPAGGMVASTPVNFVRLAATPGILAHTNQMVRLRVRQRFVPAPTTTLLGVLRAPQPSREAVVLTVNYDVRSILPDQASGPLQALDLAVHHQLLIGLAANRRTLRRDVVFLAGGASMMAEDSVNHLLRVAQQNRGARTANPFAALLKLTGTGASRHRFEPLDKDAQANEQALVRIRRLLPLWEDPEFLVGAARTAALLAGLDDGTRALFQQQFTYVLNTRVFTLDEPRLQARLAFLRTGGKDLDRPEFQDYLAAKRRSEEAAAAAGYSVANLLQSKPEFVVAHNVRDRCQERLVALREHHERRAGQLRQDRALAALFDQYDNVLVLHPQLAPAIRPDETDEELAFHSTVSPSPYQAGIVNVFQTAAQRLRLTRRIKVRAYEERSRSETAALLRDRPTQNIQMWNDWGYPALALVNPRRSEAYRQMTVPVDRPEFRNVASLRHTLAVVGESVLSLAHGNARLGAVTSAEWLDHNYSGQVLVANVGPSLVPNFPLAGALVANRPPECYPAFSLPGWYNHLLLFTDPYGRYSLPHNASDWVVRWRMYLTGGSYAPLAAGFGSDGLIHYIKDEGEDSQRLFKSVNVPALTDSDVTIVTFRAAPVSLLDLVNPQSMTDYSSVEMLTPAGLTPFRKQLALTGPGLRQTFLPPDERFFVVFRSGSPDNEFVQSIRAFALGITDPTTFTSQREIAGPGYLTADQPFLLQVPREIARSMAFVNGRRLALQQDYHMADDRTITYQQQTLDKLLAAEQSGQPHRRATLQAREAVTYATLNHPQLRRAVVEAVLGILWYLGLLVPFVFFFEKLVFGFTDIRHRLAAQASIFLVVFVLLRVLHPAFAMVRSSLMILLGFVIILISTGITILFSGKFRSNLEELRRRRGRVAAAEVNWLAAASAAFTLGLNNMHRRKVRTGLTCATLTLLTFVMICFTSTRTDLVEEERAIGRAPYQGLLLRPEQFAPVTEAAVFLLQQRYGSEFAVCRRRMQIGTVQWQDNRRFNPTVVATRRVADREWQFELHSILQMDPGEPLQERIRFLTQRRWFTTDQVRQNRDRPPVLLSATAAAALNLSPAAVDEGTAEVWLDGRQFQVQAIFEPASLAAARDLDGQDLLPFDLERMTEVIQSRSGLLATPEAPRIPAEQVAIMPCLDEFVGRTVSVAVAMPQASYKDARARCEEVMQQTGLPLFYGLDGQAYRGRITRAFTMAGLLDLIVPLVLAGLTVLNTMKGSVHERRSEIYVYNAVGIAPRYVFFMFIAEAFVYAVVGAVLGYLLSQGTGRVLTVLNLTGGLNMTFTSAATIYASLAIMAAVFLSTYFPARDAMRIAAPAEESGWSLPEPDGDVLAFDLPFLLRSRGHVAVLAFFERYLLDHGEGGAGRFQAGPPELGITTESRAADSTEYVPELRAKIWLKPFDLGVSQELRIELPTDPATKLYKARVVLHRLSGTREAWLRLNHGFVTLIRRHFLHWRAATEEEREQLYTEACARYRAQWAHEPQAPPTRGAS